METINWYQWFVWKSCVLAWHSGGGYRVWQDLLSLGSVWVPAGIGNNSNTSRPGAPSTKEFNHNSNLMANLYCCHLNLNAMNATKFCTWHDSCAVKPCAKICSNLLTKHQITGRWIYYEIWIMSETSLVKWAPDLLPYSQEWRALRWGIQSVFNAVWMYLINSMNKLVNEVADVSNVTCRHFHQWCMLIWAEVCMCCKWLCMVYLWSSFTRLISSKKTEDINILHNVFVVFSIRCWTGCENAHCLRYDNP